MGPELPQIWIVTEPNHLDGPVVPIARALAGNPGGRVGVQLRAPRHPDRRLVEWGRELRRLTRESGSLLFVNRRWDVAQIVEADGVHLPERAAPIRRIRERCPGIGPIGVSRHDRSGLDRARESGARFAFLSPVFEVPGKGAPLGIQGFADSIVDVGIPTYALGGVRAQHVAPLLAAGACGVAVRRAIYGADDPRGALQELISVLDKTAPEGG